MSILTRSAVVLFPLLAVSACGEPTGPALVSAQTPPGTGLVNAASEPEPINSFPKGAWTNGGAFATAPNYFSWTFGRR